MSILWERLAGDTDRFAVRLAFHSDPHQGEAATAEHAASWGSFQIWCEGRNLCAHLEEGQLVDRVHWYLLPLIQWIVSNWDPLLHEEKLPARNAGADAYSAMHATRFPPESYEPRRASAWEKEWHQWWNRHAIQSCREGGVFPNAYVRRHRDLIEFAWGATRVAGVEGHAAFLAPNGVSRLPPSAVAPFLRSVVGDAVTFLRSRIPTSDTFEQLAEAVDAITRRPRSGRLAWLAGLRNDVWDAVAARVHDAGDAARRKLFGEDVGELVVTGSCQAALMFGSVAPTIDAADAVQLADVLVRDFRERRPGTVADELAESVPVDATDVRPWEQASNFAEQLLEQLDIDPGGLERVDVDGISRRLGVATGELALSDSRIRAVAFVSDNHAPTVLLNPAHDTYRFPSARLFTLAHELCHLLYDRGYGNELALASGPWAPRDVERRANAFAAALLMPTALIHRVVRDMDVPLETREGVEHVAHHVGASWLATLERLGDLGFIDDDVRDRLRVAFDHSHAPPR